MLNKAGAAILTSPFSPFLLSPFVYLRLISHLFIYLFFPRLPSHSSPMYVNCVTPFNSNIGLQRALNEQSTSKHAALRLFSPSRRIPCLFLLALVSAPRLPKNPQTPLSDPHKTLIPNHPLPAPPALPSPLQIFPRTAKNFNSAEATWQNPIPDGPGRGEQLPASPRLRSAPSRLFASLLLPQPRFPDGLRAEPGPARLGSAPECPGPRCGTRGCVPALTPRTCLV